MEQYDYTDNTLENKPVFPSAEFPETSGAVRAAYETFWANAPINPSEIKAKEHTLALANTLIDDFCDNYASKPVYDIAMLGPIIDAFDDYRYTQAGTQALREYIASSSDSDETKKYIIDYLTDRVVINDFWRSSVDELYSDKPELAAELVSDTAHPIAPELWAEKARLVMPNRTDTLTDLESPDAVNLESLVIQSIETLVSLSDENAAQDSKTLQQMYRAESLFAPVCEIIGFDGLAMALQSRVHILRKTYTGNLAAVERAQAIIAEYGDEHQADEDVQALFSTVFGENIHEQVIKQAAGHGIIIGEGLATSKNVRVVWRRKSVGSLARKLDTENSNEQLPMDILGATVIAHNTEEMAERLTRVIERSHSDPNVKLMPTADRTDAVHVKGTPDYIDTVREVLGFSTVEAMKRFVDVKEVEPGAHRVSKVTLIHSREGRPDMRAEIQFTTEADRVEARIGSAAHLLYKFAGSSEQAPDPAYLAAIHSRGEDFKHGNFYSIPASAQRGAILWDYLQRGA